MGFINKKAVGFILVLMGLLVSNLSFADTDQRNTTLERINSILNQINPLITLAQKEEDPNARVKFQFDRLRGDITMIQSGIEQATHRTSIQPRIVKPLSGDYLPSEDAAP